MKWEKTANKKKSEVGNFAEDFYKKVFDAIPCYVSVQDQDFRLIASNKRFKTDFSNSIGLYCYKVYKHRDSPCIDCPVALTFSDGKSHSTEEVVTTKHGQHHNVITWTSPIYNDYGIITMVVEVSTDITSIRKLQDQLTSLGLMISSISHGIRGMLTSLDGGLYKLETGIKKNNTQRIHSAFTQIKQTTNRIRKTILEILYYSKSRQVNYKKIRVSYFMKTLEEDFRKTAENNKIILEIVNLAGYETFEIDYNWMYSAISNFVENAIDACLSKKQERICLVRVILKKIKPNQLEFLIEDNGIGMTPEVKDKLFTLFFSSKGSQGTGLGMFIANQVIARHGGSIKMSTTYQKGTSVKIKLPIFKLK